MAGRKREMELSERLLMSALLVERGSVAADVGCDHGFTSIWLVQRGICPRVLAMDVNPGPLERAGEHIREAGLSAYIETRLSDGLSAMKCPDGKPEADTLLMAGIGGRLACRIMKDAQDKLRRMRAVIVQPQSELFCVRRTLAELGYRITAENMVKEGGKFYTAIRAENAAFSGKNGFGEKEAFPADQPEAGTIPPVPADQPEAGMIPPVPDGLRLSEKDWESAGEQYGFCLLLKKHPVLREYLEDVLRRNRTAREALLEGTGRKAGECPPEEAGVLERSRARLAGLEAEAALAGTLAAWLKERGDG